MSAEDAGLGWDGGFGVLIDPVPDGGNSVSGVPCDVAQVLQTRCLTCHSNPPSGGASTRLDTRDALMGPALSVPSKTEGQLAVERMQSTTAPMPPGAGPSVPADQIAIVASWVQAGMPAGSCDTEQFDAGNPYDTPTVCTSGQYWTRGNSGSSSMNPGQACIACHKTDWEAPRFGFAGTVYPSAHEPENCRGVGGVTVVITDAKGRSYPLAANSSGNFYLSMPTGFTMPYIAKVVRADGSERAMLGPRTDGDCNSCHTETGDQDAPGRIMAP